jgi:hypothetical protein
MCKRLLFSFSAGLLFLGYSASGQKKNFIVNANDGVSVYPKSNSQPIRLQVISPKVVRASASPEKQFKKGSGLARVDSLKRSPQFTATEQNGELLLKTADLMTSVNLSPGKIHFIDKAGNLILSEEENGSHIQYTTEKNADPITIYLFTGKNASFNLYEDEGTTYNYEKGAFTEIPLHYEETIGTLSMGDRRGSFPKMLKERTFNIVGISTQNKQSINSDTIHQTAKYDGKKITIKK